MRDGQVGGGELVLVGRNKAQLREASPQSITEEQIETFFSELADTCNVVRSAKAAGFSANWAYRKRKMDAGFRAGWARAIAEGYTKLELVLLDRAMNGMVKRVPSGGTEKRIREYPNQLAMALLKRHSDMAGSIDNMLSEEEAEEVLTPPLHCRVEIIAAFATQRNRVIRAGTSAHRHAPVRRRIMLLPFVLAQAVSASPPERIDLTIPQPCRPEAASSDEVVVCANRNGESPYRLEQAPPRPKGVPKAELSVAEGVSVAGETEQADVGGVPSNRVMLRLKVKF